MFGELPKQLLDALKLAPRYLVALLLVLAFLLFMPAELLQAFGVEAFAKDYRQGIGIGVLMCTSLLLVACFLWGHKAASNILARRNFKTKMCERLRRLTEDEKQILRFYIAQQTRANTLRIDDGVVKGLVSSKIIYQSAAVGSVLDGFAHNINEIAWDELREQPGLLDGSTNLYRTDKRDNRW